MFLCRNPNQIRQHDMRVVICFIVISFFLFGCVSQKERSEKFLKENPEVLAQWCSFYFPVKDNYIKGETLHTTDTLFLPGVKIPCPEVQDKDGNTIITEVDCPEQKIITDTFTRTDTIQVEDTAKIFALMSEKQDDKAKILFQQEVIAGLRKQAKKSNIIIAALSLIIVAGISIKMFLK